MFSIAVTVIVVVVVQVACFFFLFLQYALQPFLPSKEYSAEIASVHLKMTIVITNVTVIQQFSNAYQKV